MQNVAVIVKLSLSFNLFLSLKDRDHGELYTLLFHDRDIADTIITLYHTTPSIHRKLFKPIEVRDLLPCFP